MRYSVGSGLGPRCNSRYIRTCCGMAAAMPWRTRATTHGRYRPGSATRTSSTRLGTPSWRRIDSRTSGANGVCDCGDDRRSTACRRRKTPTPTFHLLKTPAGWSGATIPSRWDFLFPAAGAVGRISPSMCSLNRMPAPALAKIISSLALRPSRGSGRRSSPFSSIRSTGQGSAGPEEDRTRHSYLQDMRWN
jgi:hypothetical protein